ncbi:hypothetical protein [Aeromonas phage AerS_266]|nr:hypothetical protein [Aeromonas phage AerS_266]
MHVELKVYAPVNTYTGSVFHTMMIAKTGIYKELIELCPGLQINHFSADETSLVIKGESNAVLEWFQMVKEYNKNFSSFTYDLQKKFKDAECSKINNLYISTKDFPIVEYVNNKWERFDNWFDNPKEKFIKPSIT